MPDSIGLNRLQLRVRQENKRQIILLGEFLMGGNGIFADTDDNNILCLELLVACGKGAGLPGAAGGIVLGIELQNNLFPQMIRQTNSPSILIREAKIRRFAIYFQHSEFSFAIIL